MLLQVVTMYYIFFKQTDHLLTTVLQCRPHPHQQHLSVYDIFSDHKIFDIALPVKRASGCSYERSTFPS